MQSTITIFDPKSKPFGSLSNNYPHRMFLDGTEWNTVTNYIFANLITTNIYKEIVKNTKPREAPDMFRTYYTKETNSIVRKAIIEALEQKVKFPQIREILQKTGTSPIFYVSDDKFLGTGNHNEGANEYGKALMQVRHTITVGLKGEEEKKEISNNDQNMYDAFLAHKILEEEIMKNDNDLKIYIGMTPSEIVDKYGRSKIIDQNISKQLFLDMVYKRGLYKNLEKYKDSPKNLVLEVRKEKMKLLRNRKLKEQNAIIFDMYADYLLEKHYKDLGILQYKEAKEQQFANLTWTQKNEIEKRIVALYEADMLSDRLSTEIEKGLADFYIPTQEDVMEALSVEITYDTSKIVKSEVFVPPSGEPILIYPVFIQNVVPEKFTEFISLSPLETFPSMFSINGKPFPSVYHYIVTQSIAHIKKETKNQQTVMIGFDEAYKLILASPDKPIVDFSNFFPPEKTKDIYFHLESYHYHELLVLFATKGMNKKFEDRGLQEILLTTEENKLVYEDFQNPILGVGPKGVKGEDFVGKYLMVLRNQILVSRKGEKLEILTADKITEILNSDGFLKEWFDMRVKDTCKVLLLLKDYYFHTQNIDSKFSALFVTEVLDYIYNPCSQLYGSSNLITAEVPDYFNRTVRRCTGFKDVSKEVVNIIWTRIAVLVYYLIEYMKDATINNVRSAIANIEQLLSEPQNCIPLIPDKYENCILSALLNLIRGIIKFNNSLSTSSRVTKTEVELAVTIILDKKDIVGLKHPQKELSDEPEEQLEEESLEEPTDKTPEEPIDQFDDDDDDDGSYGSGGDDESGGDDRSGGDDDDDDDDLLIDLSVNEDLVKDAIRDIDEIEDKSEITKLLKKAITKVKDYKMSNKIKNNRINFFASLK